MDTLEPFSYLQRYLSETALSNKNSLILSKNNKKKNESIISSIRKIDDRGKFKTLIVLAVSFQKAQCNLINKTVQFINKNIEQKKIKKTRGLALQSSNKTDL
jgi:hypothetical protein